MSFFESWRRFSDRITRVLLLAIGIISSLGGLEILYANGPPFLAVIFIGFGIATLIAGAFGIKSR